MNFFALLLDLGMKSDIMPLAPKTENKIEDKITGNDFYCNIYRPPRCTIYCLLGCGLLKLGTSKTKITAQISSKSGAAIIGKLKSADSFI